MTGTFFWGPRVDDSWPRGTFDDDPPWGPEEPIEVLRHRLSLFAGRVRALERDQREKQIRITTLEAALAVILMMNGIPLVHDGTCQFCFEDVYSDPELHKPDCFVRKERAR